MMNNFREELRHIDLTVKKPVVKKGTVAVGVVEATPVVWKDRLLRFEWVRDHDWGRVEGVTRDIGCYHFVDMETNEAGPDFALDHSFGCCHAEDGVMYVCGVRQCRYPNSNNVLDVLWSEDLVNWQEKEAIRFPEGTHVYNNSICKGPDGYIMAIEIAGKTPWPASGFTCVFAKSTNLLDWELLDMQTHAYDKDRYTACPVIRYTDGYYYIICLEKMPGYRWVPYIARSKDLVTFQLGHYNPVLWFDNDDKLVSHPEWFTPEMLENIRTAPNTNASDVDICEWNGKTVILYCWGSQSKREFLARAEYDGPMDEFLKSFFVMDEML